MKKLLFPIQILNFIIDDFNHFYYLVSKSKSKIN